MKSQKTWALLVVILIHLAQSAGHAAPPYSGTIFLDPDIITAGDPTAFTGITYTGTGPRQMFDRRVNAFVTYNAFLFSATFVDHAAVEVQVNPEFQTPALALVEAEKYARAMGQLPAVLRTDVQTMWIHQGVQPFGGGNNNILIHTGQAAQYAADGILEETLVHEASHTSLDSRHANAPGWIAAQAADNEFISTYARDNPTREDIAESFLPYLAVRQRRERIDASLAATIQSTIPNRIQYFDAQAFNFFPVLPTSEVAPPILLPATVLGSTVTISWNAPAGSAPASYRIEAGSAPGLANLAVATVAGNQRSQTFVGVPRGTYYVRMRSVGSSSVSSPSNEITINVLAGGCELPAAPQQFTATVSGRQVTLAWQASTGGTTSFDIEAGSASGLANLAILTVAGNQRSFSVTAPPGRYYVRVRARNSCGLGPSSNEVILTVP